MLDCTFKVIKYYVTCIVLGISNNTGIPLGFCFGSVEDEELYNLVFDTFYEVTKIDLSTFTIESDQGSGLIASCNKYACTHICCLRHLLVSLKNKKLVMKLANLFQVDVKKTMTCYVKNLI